MIPVIIMGGILTGWFTPTEAGMIAVGLYPGRAGAAAQPEPHPAFAARLRLYRPALFDSARRWSRRRPPSAGCSPICAAPTSSPAGSRLIAGTRRPHDHVPAGAAVHHHRRFHGRRAGDHHLHADHHQAERARQHQAAAHGRGDHHDAGVRADHAALRAVAAGRVEIRRRAVQQGDVCVAADLRRVLRRRSRFTVLFPGRRALSAEAAAAGIGRLLQEPERRAAISARPDRKRTEPACPPPIPN